MLPPSATTASLNLDIGHAFPEMAVLFPSCRLAVQPYNTSFHNNGNNDPYSRSNIDHDHTNTRAVRASSTATTCSGLCSTPAATLTKPRGSTKCQLGSLLQKIQRPARPSTLVMERCEAKLPALHALFHVPI